eukprot:TRINITY_DN2391_c0_g1_i9.p2 TRINITY_DN2391_c0_g1~~TRINITY_DN2391_c0_g1_i9.p2  ORF type:complete len:100 (+),score=6.40 TRINITY_DN2391_c0_g1_i9:88-387(+)
MEFVSKFLISPAILVEKSVQSKPSIQLIPDRPSNKFEKNSSTSCPSGDTTLIPVITTRRLPSPTDQSTPFWEYTLKYLLARDSLPLDATLTAVLQLFSP